MAKNKSSKFDIADGFFEDEIEEQGNSIPANQANQSSRKVEDEVAKQLETPPEILETPQEILPETQPEAAPKDQVQVSEAPVSSPAQETSMTREEILEAMFLKYMKKN